ncbi:MAG: RibD family protein, partial [Planctomycetota bacterium]
TRLRDCPDEIHLLSPERVADPWLKRVRTGLPWVIAKWAQTLDGRIATRSGESKWISSGQSRKRVHRLRGRCDAVVTGVGTVFADDPMLTPRDVRRVRRVPVRVVVDRDLDIPLDCALVKTASEVPTVVACDKVYTRATITADRREALESAGVTIAGVPQGPGGVDLSLLMRFLVEQYDASNVMVEAGPGLLGAFIEQDLVDEAYIYTAPLLLGDELARSVISGRVAASLASGRAYELARLKRVGNDIEAIYRRPDPSRLGD